MAIDAMLMKRILNRIFAMSLLILMILISGFTGIRTSFSASNPASIDNGHNQLMLKHLIIRKVSLGLQTDNVNMLMQQTTQLTKRFNGYVVNSRIVEGNQASGAHTAEISIRIPANDLNNLLTQLKSLATQVQFEQTYSEDITEEYVNFESKIKNLQTSKTQLTSIMTSAKKTEDVLIVQNQLSDTQTQLDVLEGYIKNYNQSVTNSLINIQMNMKPAAGVMILQNDWQLVKVIKASYERLSIQIKHTIYGFIDFVVYFIPLIILWGLILGLVFLIGQKIYYRFFPGLFGDLHQQVMTYMKRKTAVRNKEIEPTDSTRLTPDSAHNFQRFIIGIVVVAAVITWLFLHLSIPYRYRHNNVPFPQNIALPSNSYTNIYLLAGNWTHENQQTSIKMGDNNKLIFCNEQNDCATGYLSKEHLIVVPQWNVTGSINSNSNIISWSNGTFWTRN